MSVLVTVGVLALVALWAMSAYNKLVRLRNQVTHGWRQVDAQLKRRHDLMSRLADAVKGAVAFEPATLDALLAALGRAARVTGPADAGRKESELSAAFERFTALAGRSSDATENQDTRALRDELTATELKIGAARQVYNTVATKYNTATDVIPGNIIAGFAGFKAAELFEIGSGAPPAATREA